tara:strand:+ start:885 stop:1256 length:372 start_codon:yes stop_codon:yes gene_type:complete
MIGNLEPEEHVMDDSIMYPGGMLGQLSIALEKLGWEQGDNVAVEIAGTSIYEIDGAGTKWAPVKGTRKYNKDSFIIIKNLDRNPTVSSLPNTELKGHHLKSEKELAAELKKSDDAKGYDTYSK